MSKKKAEQTTKCPRGYVDFEIIEGVEGACLSITHGNGVGHRLAGPKPWGGGKVSRRFRVNIDELMREAHPPKRDERWDGDTGGGG